MYKRFGLSDNPYDMGGLYVPAPDTLPASQTINPYWDFIRTLPGDGIEMRFRGRWQPDWTATILSKEPISRHALCGRYCWAIPDPLSLEFLRDWLRPQAVEMGGGTGYIANQLAQLCIDILAYDTRPPQLVTDNHWHSPMRQKPRETTVGETEDLYESSSEFTGETRPVFFDVKQGGPEVLANYPDRTLFLCWPPYANDMASLCLAAHTGKRLVYIGEAAGGCTADARFFEMLDADWHEVASHTPIQWSGIHDEIVVYERGKAVEEEVQT